LLCCLFVIAKHTTNVVLRFTPSMRCPGQSLLDSWYNLSMNYYITKESTLKWLEVPTVYQIKTDELYELDNDSFEFFKKCASETGCASKDGGFIDYCLEEGIVTLNKPSVKRPNLLKSPDPSLRYLELQITNACNLRCKHCYIGDETKKELSTKQIRTLLNEFEKMQGLRVLITGGEPLLHDKFYELNEMLPHYAIRKILFTNGVLLSREILKTLHVDELQISIDGLEYAHDALRGSGMFKRSLEAIRQALDSGFSVSVATMVHPRNRGDFTGMERMFKEMGIKDWTVDVPVIEGRLKENSEFHIAPEEGGKYLGYGYGDGMHTAGHGHACGLHLMSIMADGRAAKCSFYTNHAVGTINEGLAALWGRTRPIRLSELSCACDYIEACRGGCRYRAEIIDGPRGRDLYRCVLYGIIGDTVDNAA